MTRSLGAPATTIRDIEKTKFFRLQGSKCITLCIAACITEFWLIERVKSTTNPCDLCWVAVRVSMLKSSRDRQV